MKDHTGIAYTTMLCTYHNDAIHLSINFAIPGSPPASSDQYVLADTHASRAGGCAYGHFVILGRNEIAEVQ